MIGDVREHAPASSASGQARRWYFASAVLDEVTLELIVGGVEAEIERKPLEVLLHLLRHAGEVVTKEELLAAVWPGRILSDTVLAKAIGRVREALKDGDQDLIKTVYGYGYRLMAPVRIEMQRVPERTHFNFSAGDHPPGRPLWSLMHRLGAGGHGEAWLGQHEKTREQRVFKFAIDESSLAALKREITLFRFLNDSLGERARIVSLIDWNLEQPPCFIESEYVAGGSLLDWAERSGGLARIPLAMRIDVAAQIAETLGAVHSVGVLHKDLKPSNILIDSDGVNRPSIRLADFGSGGVLDAQQLEALGITRMGFTKTVAVPEGTSGTPLYLAPELLAGQPPTVQADIYALGVLLYQLVVGEFRKALSTGWEREVDDELLRSDIAQAAEGEPSRRLSDAAELAQRLRTLGERRQQREEEHRLRARAETLRLATERMRARRNALIFAFLAMATGLTVSTWLYFDARKARALAEKEATRAQAVADFLGKDLFSTVNSGQKSVKDLTASEILDGAVQAVDKRFAGQPEAAAQVHESIGRSYYQLGLGVKAANELEKALQLYEQVQGADGESVAALIAPLADTTYIAGTLATRMEHFDALLAASENRWGPQHLNVLRSRASLARAQLRLGAWRAAADSFRRIVKAGKNSTATDDELFLDARKYLAAALLELHEFSEAEPLLVDLLKELATKKGENHLDVGIAYQRLGRIFVETNRHAAAELELQKSLGILRAWEPETGGRVQTSLMYLGQLRLAERRTSEAMNLLESVLHTIEAWNFGGIDQTGEARRALSAVYRSTGRWGEAENQLARALAAHTKAIGESHPWTQEARNELAELLLERGRVDEARGLFLETRRAAFNGLPLEHPFRVLDRRLSVQLGLSQPSGL